MLTNLPIVSADEARGVVEDYACRWMIEDYHKAQKAGCRTEKAQMTTLHGLSNVIALVSVLAVHVLRLRWLARDERTGQQPARLYAPGRHVRRRVADERVRCVQTSSLTVAARSC
ncbi:MAG: hypothetical protein JNG88_09690 [Phycisphaerales bacterium]|nr:hypothetical protein [Phycisphaerales bacterium]